MSDKKTIKTEAEWVDKFLSRKPRDWQELVRSGRAYLDKLPAGNLKTLIETFLKAESAIDKELKKLGYEKE